MESPRSERSQTRFSTPVTDLDDHRNQPTSLPRADTMGGAHDSAVTRRGTVTSMDESHPELLRVRNALQEAGPQSRDFEQAVEDDERILGEHMHDDERGAEKKSPARTTIPRRGTLRINETMPEKPSRSRDSSTSRSTSPPNSVDAFADPRRRERANTIGSKAPSDLDLVLHRTVSGETHRRRPTISDGSVVPGEGRRETWSGPEHDSAEEDVCFPPPEETSKAHMINFEELEEFVAENARGRTPVAAHNLRRHSLSSQSKKPKVFSDLRPKGTKGQVPPIVTHFTSPARSGTDYGTNEVKFVLDEKDGVALDSMGPCDRRQSNVEPSRFSFFSSEMESTVHAAELRDLRMPGESFRDLFSLGPGGGVWWLDVLNPSEEEINAISRAFAIHPLTSEDIKTQETREKVELFPRYYFVCFRSFEQMDKTSEDYMEIVNVYMVVYREGVISFTFRPSPHALNVRKRIGKLRDYVALSSDWICYAMIDDIVDTFGPAIDDTEREAEMIEDQVFVARPDDYTSLLRQIGECRKRVMGLMRLLGGKADVIKGFAKRCNEQYSVTPRGEIGLYLGDIQDHVITMMSNLGHFEKMLSRSHSNYLAQISVDQIAQGNHANNVLSKITFIATVLVPLNLICGIFGMNVPVPGSGRGDEGYQWFGGIMGVIGAIVAFSLLAARRYKLL